MPFQIGHKIRLLHGANARGKRTPEYSTWASMVSRCSNPRNSSYEDYGGRGITVCKRWLAFSNFLADMGPKPPSKRSIERKNNSLGYFPDNCEWVGAVRQQNNKRTSRFIAYRGKSMTMAEWSESTGLSYWVIKKRANLGWPSRRILNTPVRSHR